IVRPSGDHSGWLLVCEEKVIRREVPWSTSINQISAPASKRTAAICLPSGEKRVVEFRYWPASPSVRSFFPARSNKVSVATRPGEYSNVPVVDTATAMNPDPPTIPTSSGSGRGSPENLSAAPSNSWATNVPPRRQRRYPRPSGPDVYSALVSDATSLTRSFGFSNDAA